MDKTINLEVENGDQGGGFAHMYFSEQIPLSNKLTVNKQKQQHRLQHNKYAKPQELDTTGCLLSSKFLAPQLHTSNN